MPKRYRKASNSSKNSGSSKLLSSGQKTTAIPKRAAQMQPPSLNKHCTVVMVKKRVVNTYSKVFPRQVLNKHHFLTPDTPIIEQFELPSHLLKESTIDTPMTSGTIDCESQTKCQPKMKSLSGSSCPQQQTPATVSKPKRSRIAEDVDIGPDGPGPIKRQKRKASQAQRMKEPKPSTVRKKNERKREKTMNRGKKKNAGIGSSCALEEEVANCKEYLSEAEKSLQSREHTDMETATTSSSPPVMDSLNHVQFSSNLNNVSMEMTCEAASHRYSTTSIGRKISASADAFLFKDVICARAALGSTKEKMKVFLKTVAAGKSTHQDGDVDRDALCVAAYEAETDTTVPGSNTKNSPPLSSGGYTEECSLVSLPSSGASSGTSVSDSTGSMVIHDASNLAESCALSDCSSVKERPISDHLGEQPAFQDQPQAKKDTEKCLFTRRETTRDCSAVAVDDEEDTIEQTRGIGLEERDLGLHSTLPNLDFSAEAPDSSGAVESDQSSSEDGYTVLDVESAQHRIKGITLSQRKGRQLRVNLKSLCYGQQDSERDKERKSKEKGHEAAEVRPRRGRLQGGADSSSGTRDCTVKRSKSSKKSDTFLETRTAISGARTLKRRSGGRVVRHKYQTPISAATPSSEGREASTPVTGMAAHGTCRSKTTTQLQTPKLQPQQQQQQSDRYPITSTPLHSSSTHSNPHSSHLPPLPTISPVLPLDDTVAPSSVALTSKAEPANIKLKVNHKTLQRKESPHHHHITCIPGKHSKHAVNAQSKPALGNSTKTHAKCTTSTTRKSASQLPQLQGSCQRSQQHKGSNVRKGRRPGCRRTAGDCSPAERSSDWVGSTMEELMDFDEIGFQASDILELTDVSSKPQRQSAATAKTRANSSFGFTEVFSSPSEGGTQSLDTHTQQESLEKQVMSPKTTKNQGTSSRKQKDSKRARIITTQCTARKYKKINKAKSSRKELPNTANTKKPQGKKTTAKTKNHLRKRRCIIPLLLRRAKNRMLHHPYRCTRSSANSAHKERSKSATLQPDSSPSTLDPCSYPLCILVKLSDPSL